MKIKQVKNNRSVSILYAYVSEENKTYLTKLAKKLDRKLSTILDAIISDHKKANG